MSKLRQPRKLDQSSEIYNLGIRYYIAVQPDLKIINGRTDMECCEPDHFNSQRPYDILIDFSKPWLTHGCENYRDEGGVKMVAQPPLFLFL